MGRIYTWWVIILSYCYTATVCMRAVCKGYLGTINRAWVDKNIQNWSGRLLDLVKVDYTVINPHNVQPQPGRATILMCNHVSAYDIPLSFKVFPNHSLRMLAKKELSKIPFMGAGMKAAEFPFIDRRNITQAVKDLAQVKALMESGIMIWIAPEGTRSKDGKLAAFKKGAFITAIEANAIIIPMGIRGAEHILPAKTHQLQLHQKAELHIGEPIDAAQFTDKNVLLQTVHAAMKVLVEGDSNI